jgi:hypothetical protein
MNKIKKFVSNLLKDYFNETEKLELINILTTSLEEKVEDLVEQGTPIDQAISISINEFGNAEDVLEAYPDKKRQAHKKYIHKRKSQFLFSVLGYLAIVGICAFFNITFIQFFKHPWYVLVAIGTIFWPGSMLFHYLSARK